MSENDRIVVARRRLIAGAGALAVLGPGRVLAATVGSTADRGYAEIPDGALAEQTLSPLSGKVPLIKKTFRPPNYETPPEYFRSVITPNNAFFVRWHLAGIPEVSARDWKLAIAGESVERPASYTLAQLRKEFPQIEITAVCQCSGNRRGLFEPHVAGVEWGVGAMGNAVWRGVRLKDLLAKAGLRSNAIEIVFNGADRAPIDKTPDFVKSIPVEVALDENTLIAFDMNGAPLPHWNGFPARLVVPGWTGTYWMKQLISINAVSAPESNFWMKTAYRLPRGKYPGQSFKTQLAETTEPITNIVTNSMITSIRFGQQFPHGKPVDVAGIAWDGGSGIDRVEVSTDGGDNWKPAKLGRDHGRFSFREFSMTVPTRAPGTMVVMARATSRGGQTQTERLSYNPAGYHHNVIQRLYVEIV
ncbi:MAG: molybdopterin-dependent oxidoreductase [Betaproteobacteria bacterium]